MGFDDKGASPIVGAVCWLLALEGSPKDEVLRTDFILWLRADPNNGAAWANASGMFDVMANPPSDFAEDWAPHISATLKVLEQRMASVLRPAPNWMLRVAVGMAAAVAMWVAILVVPSLLISFEADYETATAEKRALEFEDGSFVVIAPESAIVIDHSETKRLVRLLKGEAFFYVTPNADRPFRVIAGDATARTVGATFNVQLGDEDTTISVRHGLVDVAYGADQQLDGQLEEGDWATVADGDRVQRKSGRYQDVGAWTHDELIVRDRRLGDVVDEMRRYIPGVIILVDSELSNERVTNSGFNLAKPVAALRNIASRRRAEVHQLLPGVLLIRRD
ncbi:MAG: FecR domain-containing protein [Parvibaculaceae bacterium]|nr:FecR domain-containing protein [Parvibaculaceae bacterium]